ncbi:hypothetical protein LOD99_14857 [Oopsacas minuta]|uniref:Uncharacterized protein n=1 Tax=Oopsacas minuta TaxID=111878 RepID=A0AAV7KE88_9METZ|nr:hypothetical protein LOD99_14857 [Oopsacas minuta]
MPCCQVRWCIVIFAIPFTVSVLYIAISSVLLLLLTNTNVDGLKDICIHYLNHTTDDDLNQCILPLLRIFHNLLSICLVITSVVIILLFRNAYADTKKKWGKEVRLLTFEITELHDEIGALHVESQRVRGQPNTNPIRNDMQNTSQQMTELEYLPCAREDLETGEETDSLIDHLPNYGAVIGEEPQPNQVNQLLYYKYPHP